MHRERRPGREGCLFKEKRKKKIRGNFLHGRKGAFQGLARNQHVFVHFLHSALIIFVAACLPPASLALATLGVQLTSWSPSCPKGGLPVPTSEVSTSQGGYYLSFGLNSYKESTASGPRVVDLVTAPHPRFPAALCGTGTVSAPTFSAGEPSRITTSRFGFSCHLSLLPLEGGRLNLGPTLRFHAPPAMGHH